MSSFVERERPKVSWQAERSVKANKMASRMTLSDMITYHEWLKTRIKDNSLKHRQELMVVAKAIELKVKGV